MSNGPVTDDDDIVPIDFDPKAEQLNAEPSDAEPEPTDLDMMIELLQLYDVEYTLISDEAGTTIELPAGARGVFGFAGLAITINYAPEFKGEKFLFFGLAK